MLCGFLVGVPWAFIVMPLMDTGDSALFGVAIVVTYAVAGVVNGPLASFIPKTFVTFYRYTGVGLAFSAGGIIGGAVAPVFAGVLAASVGGRAIGLTMAILVLTSLSCTVSCSPETRGNTLMDSKVRPTP